MDIAQSSGGSRIGLGRGHEVGGTHRLVEDAGVGEQGGSARLGVDRDVASDILGERCPDAEGGERVLAFGDLLQGAKDLLAFGREIRGGERREVERVTGHRGSLAFGRREEDLHHSIVFGGPDPRRGGRLLDSSRAPGRLSARRRARVD